MVVEHCAPDVRAVGYSDTSNQVANDRGGPVVASAKCKSAEDKGLRPEVRIPVAKQDGEATKLDAAFTCYSFQKVNQGLGIDRASQRAQRVEFAP